MATDFSHLALWICHATFFWHAKFLLRDLQLALWIFSCNLRTSSVLLLLRFFFFFITTFCNLITIYLGYCLLLLNSMGILCDSWIWMSVCFPWLRKFSAIISWNEFPVPFSLFFFFWDSYDINVIIFDGFTEFPKPILMLHKSSFSSLQFH